jgi:hypothetical protein
MIKTREMDLQIKPVHDAVDLPIGYMWYLRITRPTIIKKDKVLEYMSTQRTDSPIACYDDFTQWMQQAKGELL